MEREGGRCGVNADRRTRPGVVGEAWGRYRDLTGVSVAMCYGLSCVWGWHWVGQWPDSVMVRSALRTWKVRMWSVGSWVIRRSLRMS